ncbi:hypothetical protein RHMOL_Rhmol01G0148700 [Rhododendron molle]|uniref:Uncharacterized protein n=1 Tax=Rhododendron molle TaxID=49168 RepID=A0ACC0Q330_RHOML|nr:hypothetical protein RHMOL_Rhmol01G0148700 [Rhododendron molle]
MKGMNFALGDEVEAVIHGGDTPTVPGKSTKRKAKAKVKPLKAQKQRTSRPELAAWDHFDKIEAKDTANGIQQGICNYCRNEYMADPKMSGTSRTLAHIIVCKKYPYNREPKFCKALQPKFEPISRYTVARDVVKIVNKEKAKLMNVLRGHGISLTTDTWTLIQNLNYMCLTAHFIDDDWKLHKKILNFCIVDDHKGDTIGKKIEACLLEWNIGGVFTITVDNASSNAMAIRYLVKKTKDWEGTVFGHNYLHVRCRAHILNLIVRDGLEERAPSIACIREVVRYVRSSPSRLDSFKKCVLKGKIESKKYLCLDISTRWNSTYLMLDAAQKFEKAFGRLHEEDSNFKEIFKDDEFS